MSHFADSNGKATILKTACGFDLPKWLCTLVSKRENYSKLLELLELLQQNRVRFAWNVIAKLSKLT